MKRSKSPIFVLALLVGFSVSPIQSSHSSDFVPLTLVSSQKWNGVVGDRNSLGKTIILARNDSSFTLGNVQAMVSYFDGAGKLLKTSNTYGAMLSRVAPGETIGVFDIFTDQPSTFRVQLVAGIPTSTPANRNIRIDSVSWNAPDAQGYKFLKVQVTNLNKTVAQSVQFMANCGNFGGPYIFDGPTFPSSLEAGATVTLYQIYGPKSPPCNNVPTVIGDATSAPSTEVFPLNYISATEKAAAEKIAADKAAADRAAAELRARQEAEARAAAELRARQEAEAKVTIDATNEVIDAANAATDAALAASEAAEAATLVAQVASDAVAALSETVTQLIADLQAQIKSLSAIVAKLAQR